jgi:polygalacturonase
MKSGKNEDGRARNMPTENVIVENCIVYHGHGGFVVGSEMSGDVCNIMVKKCSFMGTDVGLRFKSTRGRGGVVENIYIEDVNMTDIPTDPLLFDLFYGGKSPAEEDYVEQTDNSQNIPAVTIETPAFKNIFINNVVSNNSERAMFFNGLPEMKVLNVRVENSVFSAGTGAVINQTNGIIMKNVKIDNKTGETIQLKNVENATFEHVTNLSGQPAKIKQSGKNDNIIIK